MAEAAYGEAVRKVRRLIEEGRARLEDDHRNITKRLSLGLDFEHYNVKDDSEVPSRILPRDPGIFDIVRYKASLILKRFPISIRCRPEDDSAGDFANEGADEVKDMVEEWLENSRNRYRDTRRRVVWGGFAAGAWAARLDYDPERRTAVVRPTDPRNVILPQGILDPHDPDCEYVIFLDRVATDKVRRMKKWKGAANAMPDAGYDFPGAEAGSSSKHPGQVNLGENANADSDDNYPGQLTTIAYCFYRTSDKTKAVKGEGKVDPGMDRMLCNSCHWSSPPQAESPQQYPLAMQCPQCGGLATLTDQPITHEPAYPDGRYVISAPLNDGLSEPFYDDAWPVQWPTYPVLWWTPYIYPHRLLPQSDVSIHKTGVLASNAIVRMTFEQAMRARPIMRMPPLGTYLSASGQPWSGRPQDGDMMFLSATAGPAPPADIMQGTPLNTSLFSLYDRLQGRFRENTGTSQIALDPQQSKDIPVGTVQAMTETGNVPLDEHGATLYEAEGPLMDCLAATLQMAYVPARKILRPNQQGVDAFKTVSGATTPRVRVEVSAGPSLDTLDMAKLDSYQKLVQLPPQYRRGLARFARIPSEVVNQIEQDDAKFKQQQMADDNFVMTRAKQIMAGTPGGPGVPGPGGPPQGPGGMVPQGQMTGAANG
jgi:hypothetical protein